MRIREKNGQFALHSTGFSLVLFPVFQSPEPELEAFKQRGVILRFLQVRLGSLSWGGLGGGAHIISIRYSHGISLLYF